MRWQIIALLIVATSVAHADRPAICIIGRSECRTIVLAEVSVGKVVNSTTNFDTHIDVEGGILANLGVKSGGGISLGLSSLAADRGVTLFTIKWRYRYWFHPYIAAEGAVALLSGEGSSGTGVRGEAAIVLADQVGLVAGITSARTHDPDYIKTIHVVEAFIAIRFGGFAFIPAGAVGGLMAMGGD